MKADLILFNGKIYKSKRDSLNLLSEISKTTLSPGAALMSFCAVIVALRNRPHFPQPVQPSLCPITTLAFAPSAEATTPTHFIIVHPFCIPRNKINRPHYCFSTIAMPNSSS